MDNHQFQKINPPRQLSSEEIEILEKLLLADFKGNSTLRNQIREILVSEECKICQSIRFTHSQPDIIPAPKIQNPLVEAEGNDLDGATVHILLFVNDGLLDELSIYREDLKKVIKLPDCQSMQINARE